MLLVPLRPWLRRSLLCWSQQRGHVRQKEFLSWRCSIPLSGVAYDIVANGVSTAAEIMCVPVYFNLGGEMLQHI